MNERIKKLRKMLDLTQQEFGNRIGMKQNTIALIEKGRNTSDQTIFSICREFNVNEEWLRSGTGEMFKPATNEVLDELAKDHGLTLGEQIMIEKFINMKRESRAVLMDYIIEVAAAFNNQQAPASPYDPADPCSVDIDVETASYRQELEDQKKVAEKSSALGGIKEA
ncbi:MAG: helix-turn-helix transcriptional regulator [Oscillospiraceae bacterium]|nr:helix-turn-helix transcriptional regulator [Oscillospiraceae bacterium]